MRVVITGGAGFVGSHLCDRLLAEGHHVICFDNFLTGRHSNVAHLRSEPRFELHCQDVTDSVDVDGRVDAVLHFASPASPVDYQSFPLETLRVGALGTLRTLELAEQHGARFVLASTSEVYGDPTVHPQPETYWGNVNPIGPRSMYDEAKRYSEALTTTFRAAKGTNTAIIRIFNTYGPRMRPDDGRAIPTFVTQALSGNPVTVAGDGRQTRSVCYVDDLVEGIVRTLASDVAGPLNIGNPHEMSVLELARLVIDLCGADVPIVFVPRPGDDPMVRQPDIVRARTELGWNPTVDIQSGLLRTISWFRADAVAAASLMTDVPLPRQESAQPARAPQASGG
ncbi:epimerase [Parafrankia colletiae]|uniref:Epimerase n=1 Tax=Parafrankia colletiae TaxID=573497 RepID=A0A1S1RJ72_9ACTN|nr:UDP-glucuronic acid decarboxylase family protein [Parafrankia colletiae]MCK9903289.1 SDR family oxidoreductase [Frankia sp. Cpl3]OHV46260.1 epimerase [Parafrankia colletiae]